MKQPTRNELAEYGLTISGWQEIVTACRDNVSTVDDCGYGHNATQLAEIVANLELNHSEWLDDETHPLWDVASDVCDEADKAQYEADEYLTVYPQGV